MVESHDLEARQFFILLVFFTRKHGLAAPDNYTSINFLASISLHLHLCFLDILLVVFEGFFLLSLRVELSECFIDVDLFVQILIVKYGYFTIFNELF
jgi:hypothetical protein